jgi:hypothetical protein
MKLTIMDRIMIYELLPAKGDYKTLKAVKEFRDKELRFTREETEMYDISQEVVGDGHVQIRFNQEAASSYERDIKIPLNVKAAIIERLKELDKTKNLREEQLNLYEKFIS